MVWNVLANQNPLCFVLKSSCKSIHKLGLHFKLLNNSFWRSSVDGYLNPTLSYVTLTLAPTPKLTLILPQKKGIHLNEHRWMFLVTNACWPSMGLTSGLSSRLKKSWRFLYCLRSSISASLTSQLKSHEYRLYIGNRRTSGTLTLFTWPHTRDRKRKGIAR